MFRTQSLSRRPEAACAPVLALFLLLLLNLAAPARADIVFQNQTTGQLVDWMVDGITLVKYALPPTTGTAVWKVAGSGDFTGDGKPDLLFQNQQTGQLLYWQMDGANFIRWNYLSPSMPGPVDWKVAAVGDLDGDGKSDILFQNQTTGQLVYWLMNGTALKSYGFLADPGSANWKIVGAADFNLDGKLDLLFQNQQTGQLVYWLMDHTTLLSYGFLPNPGSAVWRVAGLDDFNGDGKPDVLFQNQQTGKLVYWLLDGASLTNIGFLSPDNPGATDWKVTTVWAGQTGSAAGTIQ